MIAVFFDENDANDSDEWPQLVYSGDYYSDYHQKVMPGEWTLYHGDRDSDDGCEVLNTGVRGAENVAAASTIAALVVES